MAKVRVSPGVYRDDGKPAAKGNGIAAKPPAANSKGSSGQKLTGLTSNQNKAINLRQDADISLQTGANKLLPGAVDAYGQPFDYSKLPTSPWEQYGDVKGMATDYQKQVMDQFEADMNPQFQQEQQDFEQMAATRGWPVGSEIYEKEKNRMMKGQESARQAARTGALQASDAYATNWNTMQTNNWQNAYGFESDKRNRPLSEFNALAGSVSGMPEQNLAFSQGYKMMKDTPRGGGGGGGGGQPPIWSQYGFGTPQEYDAYKTSQARDQYMWEKSQQPKGPSSGSQLGGQILGTGLGMLGMYAGKNWF